MKNDSYGLYALHVDIKMTLESHNFFLMWNMTNVSHILAHVVVHMEYYL